MIDLNEAFRVLGNNEGRGWVSGFFAFKYIKNKWTSKDVTKEMIARRKKEDSEKIGTQ